MGQGESIMQLALDTRFGPACASVAGDRLVAFAFAPSKSIEAASDPALVRAFEAAVERGEPSPLALAPAGTEFQQAVWELLRTIPAGQTRSYGWLARTLGRAGAERAVGSANAANPIALFIPCHRVVRSDGDLGGYAWGVALKRALLEAEGAFVTAQQSTLDF